MESGERVHISEYVSFFLFIEALFSMLIIVLFPINPRFGSSLMGFLPYLVFIFSLFQLIHLFIDKELKKIERVVLFLLMSGLLAPFLPTKTAYEWMFSFSYSFFVGMIVPTMVLTYELTKEKRLLPLERSRVKWIGLVLLVLFSLIAMATVAMNIEPNPKIYEKSQYRVLQRGENL